MTHRLPCSILHRPFLTVLGLGLLAGLIAPDTPAAPLPAPVPPLITSAIRFTDNVNGTVTDSVTGLVWLKDANCFGAQNWSAALSLANGLVSGSCSLSDGSTAGQWRLPNRNELQSLIDYTKGNPALPAEHPFTNVQSGSYWSSTAYFPSPTDTAWHVGCGVGGGTASMSDKTTSLYVWPVRGGL